MVIDNQKTDEEDDETQRRTLIAQMDTAMTIVIDEKIIDEIEKTGFPRSFIIQSLNNDELNYATTFYHLLSIQKEY